jgi:hypothetical protein
MSQNDLTKNDLTSENDLTENELLSQLHPQLLSQLFSQLLSQLPSQLPSQLLSQLLSQNSPEVPSISKPYLNYYSTCAEILYKINNLLFFLIIRYPIKVFYLNVLENIINE